jgi:hypothetical protein
MQRIVIVSLAAAIGGSLAAQSNTVPGLNGRLTNVSAITVLGNTATTIGCAAQNDMCNPGTVQIPWQSAMQENHPKFGFMVARESNGRFEQISDRSFCKHAFTSVNGSGGCGTCQGTGGLGGSVMGIGCTDAYGVGNNGDRTWLGPADEIDPWLGTWNHIGSYFDRGDPDVGPPNNTDGVRSLNTGAFDSVKNRVTINISDLGVAGAAYWYQIHLLHQGEAVANRTDNLMSRGVTFSGGGTSWSSSDSGVATYGSILTRWTGATVNLAGNGTDDGRFAVGVKVTGPTAGMYHYEWAVHNIDNSRGGATFHVPVDPSATVANIGFRDIDSNSLNDWTASRVGNEVVWSAPASNPQNWNTIYNFRFDCSLGPSNAPVTIDEARIGTGALFVQINSQAPSGGLPIATVTTVGAPCGLRNCQSTVYEYFASAAGFDLSNNGMTMTLSGGQYTVGSGTGTFVAPTGSTLGLGDDTQTTLALPFALPYPGGTTNQIVVCSNGFISPSSNGTDYTPTASGFLAGGPRWAPAWHDYIDSAAGGGGGTIRFDSSPSVVRVTWSGVFSYGTTSPATFQVQFFPNGTVNYIWQTMTPAGNAYLVGWTPGSGAADPGSRDLSVTLPTPLVLCAAPFTGITLNSSARPVLNTTINLITSNIPAGSPFGALVLSFTTPVPPTDLTGIGMPGCLGYVSGGSTILYLSPGATAQSALAIPNVAAFTGVTVYGQSFTNSPGYTPLGVIATNGLTLVLGPQ